MSRFGGASVIELIQDHRAGTFRAVYTVRFKEIIVVLHAFQKKSKKGKETPKQDMELINSRLKLAEEMYKPTFRTPPQGKTIRLDLFRWGIDVLF